MKKRNTLLWMLLFSLTCNTLVTLNINVAIISMVRTVQESDVNFNISKTIVCPNTTFFWDETREEENDSVNLRQNDTYEWTDHEKRSALSAYHWLSFLSILPGSVLAQKFGSKIVLGYSLFISAVMSSIVPYVAQYGATIVMYVRMIQGFFSFIAVPGAATTIIGNWSSEGDRGKFIAVCAGGAYVALGVGSIVFGYIGQYIHWKYIFHLTSLLGTVWTCLWYFLVYDYPELHPTISNEEKSKIQKSMKYAVTTEKIPIPWKEIFTSVPVIVCTLLIGASMCNFFVLTTFMPTYLNDIFGLNSNQAGFIVSLPQFVCGICGFGIGWFIDFLIEKRWLSVIHTRKLFTLGGCLTSSAMLIVMAYTKCNLTVIVIAFIVCTVSRCIDLFGIEPVIIDLSPKFCGVVNGITGTTTEIMALGIVSGISHLTKFLSTEEFWKVVFLFNATIGIGSSILFLIWGSAETQPWNQGSKKVRGKNMSHPAHVLNPVESEA